MPHLLILMTLLGPAGAAEPEMNRVATLDDIGLRAYAGRVLEEMDDHITVSEVRSAQLRGRRRADERACVDANLSALRVRRVIAATSQPGLEEALTRGDETTARGLAASLAVELEAFRDQAAEVDGCRPVPGFTRIEVDDPFEAADAEPDRHPGPISVTMPF